VHHVPNQENEQPGIYVKDICFRTILRVWYWLYFNYYC